MTLLEVDALVWGHRGQAFGGPWSARLSRGEALAVLGPNGAGKTTLFRTLIGAAPALGGAVRWGGQPLRRIAPAALAAAVAFVPQHPALALGLTAAEYVMLGCVARIGPFARPSAADREAVAHALARLDLQVLADRPLDRLSGGERQLAGIARALAQRAGVLVLDEPTASLDFANQARVLAQLASLVEEGLGVVFSTHQPAQAHRLARSVLALDGRGLTRFGPAHEILTPALLSRVYGVPVTRTDLAGGEALFSVA